MSIGSWPRSFGRGSWPRSFGRTPKLRRLPGRPALLRTLALVVAVGLIAWLAWLWYQGSSFVRVRQVTVIGLSGPDVPEIRAALTNAALGMTTLQLQVSKLEQSVQAYPYVESITVSRQGAHAITIDVAEQVPVALLVAGGHAQVVDGRDQILTQSTIPHGLLPQVSLRLLPTGSTVTSPGARSAIAVLAAAPYPLLFHLQSATWSADHGVIVRLRNGPALYFGATAQLAQKWHDAVAVLQNSSSAGAAYIDLTDPGRPAAGVAVTAAQAQSLGLEPGTTSSAQAATTATASSSTASTTTTASTPVTAGSTPPTTSAAAASAAPGQPSTSTSG